VSGIQGRFAHDAASASRRGLRQQASNDARDAVVFAARQRFELIVHTRRHAHAEDLGISGLHANPLGAGMPVTPE
jgi:hypothetical protein